MGGNFFFEQRVWQRKLDRTTSIIEVYCEFLKDVKTTYDVRNGLKYATCLLFTQWHFID